MRLAALLAASALLGPAAAWAQEAAPPAAAAAPAAADTHQDDASKFFMFHRAGVSAETARGDYAYCAGLVAPMVAQARGGYGDAMGGGLLAGIVNAIQDANEVRRMKDASMRLCMNMHGYQRYYLPEAQWNEIVRAPDALDRMAAYASGPAPASERLDP